MRVVLVTMMSMLLVMVMMDMIVMRQILGAFEANAFSEHDLRLARERWAASSGNTTNTTNNNNNANTNTPVKRKRAQVCAMDVVGDGVEGGDETGAKRAERDRDGSKDKATRYFGLKYLTSSRLLRLQLRDPTLRLQVPPVALVYVCRLP